MANPFSRAQQEQADYYRTDITPRASAGGLSVFPTSRQALTPPVSSSGNGPAPDQPMRRPSQFTPGSLFWLLSGGANAPSQEEYLLDRQQRQKDAVGQKRSLAYQKMSGLVESGLSPQKAFLKFVNTPEGMDFVMTDPDPEGAMSDFLKIAAPPQLDPKDQLEREKFGLDREKFGLEQKKFEAERSDKEKQAAAREKAFGITPPGSDQATVELFPEEPLAGSGVKVKRPDTGEEVEVAPGEETGDAWRQKARMLQAGGDYQGAQAALEIAKQLDAKDVAPGSEKFNAAKQREAMITLQIDAGKEVFKQADAAAKVLPTLQQISKLSQNVPGGYKGALAPYVARIASTFGWDIPKSASDAEALNALNQQLLPLVRQPGQVSNYEQQTYQQALPSLLQSREGRIKIAHALMLQAEHARKRATVYEKYIGTDQLQEKLGELDNQNVFDPETNKLFERAAKGEKIFTNDGEEASRPPQRQGPNPPLVQNDDDWKKIPPGGVFMTADGNIRVRPLENVAPKKPGNRTRTGGSY